METREYEFIDKPRVSRIRKLSPIKAWKPRNGSMMYILEIEFENNDYVKFFGNTITECEQFTEGEKYLYQINTTTVISENEEPKTKNKFVFVKHLLPEKVESRMKWVEETHLYIKKSAELAVNSFGSDGLNSFNEADFKDRASLIFDWMKTTLFNIDFSEADGKEFDAFCKENEKSIF